MSGGRRSVSAVRTAVVEAKGGRDPFAGISQTTRNPQSKARWSGVEFLALDRGRDVGE